VEARLRKFYSNLKWFEYGSNGNSPAESMEGDYSSLVNCLGQAALFFLQEHIGEIQVIALNEVWIDHKREIHIWYYLK